MDGDWYFAIVNFVVFVIIFIALYFSSLLFLVCLEAEQWNILEI